MVAYGTADRPSDSGIPDHRHPWLGKWMGGDRVSGVRPEDRALLGSNPSAVVDSNTAGLGSLSAAQAGLLRDRPESDKSQGVRGTASPERPASGSQASDGRQH